MLLAFMEDRLHMTINQQIFDLNNDVATQEYVASVLDYDEKTNMVKIEQRNYFKVGDEVTVYTLHIVREDAELFVGFKNLKEKDIFKIV